MGDVVNLNQARKARAKAQKSQTAKSNRVLFGRSKAERSASRIEAERDRKALDGARREPDARSDD
ncbi:DUF4169 family protein [Brevundimonas sp. VNH65]|uniref:DUF4169 family protein n=1 Tax=Brevundimonas sp. VNH65 TaxID=3400917 RepID=UPI003C0DACFD